MISLVNSLALLSFATLGLAIPVQLESREALANSRHVCTVQKSANPGDYCNFRGKLSKPATAISTTTGGTLVDCRNACLLDSNCKSYGYTFSGQVCNLYKVTVDVQGPGTNKPNGPISYSNKKCFTATYYKDLAIVNPGFESGNLSPWFEQFVPESPNSSVGVVQGGNNSPYAVELKVNNTEAATGDPDLNAYATQKINVCKGLSYSFYYSFYVVPGSFAKRGGCVPNIHIFLNNPGGTSDFSQLYVLDEGEEGGWYSFGYGFSPSTSGIYTVQVQSNACPGASAAVRWDDIQLQTYPKP